MFTCFIRRLRRLFRDESGPTAVEYAVMLALIIATCLISIRLVGTRANKTFNSTSKALDPNAKTDGNIDGNGQI